MIPIRCEHCENITRCTVCGNEINGFHHVGVRASGIVKSSIVHYASPCKHRIDVRSGVSTTQAKGSLAVYNGGPIWENGYEWFNVFWGSFWQGNSWIGRLNTAVMNIEKDPSYSGQLKQYNVGIGTVRGSIVIDKEPPSSVGAVDLGKFISGWISSGQIPDLGAKGAYNIFLPPGITATLSSDKSCVVFCDYHDTVNGDSGPFFTCEPYPCSSGCNQCDSDPFDTLTQGLSEEMVELKTDMNPGTGWVIGNLELCDYCDQNFVCNRIATGEYVNSWYNNAAGKCWTPD